MGLLFENTLWVIDEVVLIGMSAFLNITYTFVGQITLPSVSVSDISGEAKRAEPTAQFIAEMKNPRDFPKGEYKLSISTRIQC